MIRACSTLFTEPLQTVKVHTLQDLQREIGGSVDQRRSMIERGMSAQNDYYIDTEAKLRQSKDSCTLVVEFHHAVNSRSGATRVTVVTRDG